MSGTFAALGYAWQVLDPSQEYRRRAEARRLHSSELERRSHLIGNLRLADFAAGLMCAWAALSHRHYLPLWTVLIFAAGFVALAVWHERVTEKQRCAVKAGQVYERGLARSEDRWVGTGTTGERYRVRDHVFADDVDLFGRGSLFELLSNARTRIGEATLAEWLLSPARLPEILERQQAVRELSPNLDLREDLAVLGSDIRDPKETTALFGWAEAQPVAVSTSFRAIAFVLMVAAIAATVIGFVTEFWTPLILIVAVEGAVAWRWRKRIEQIVDPVSGAGADLALVSELLGRVEKEKFQSTKLRALARGLESATEPPSRSMARLKKLVNWADSRHNMLVRFLDVPLLYSLQVSFAVESWRRAHGKSVRQWLTSMGELEALESLAAYSYEHPSDPFPEILDCDRPLFAGEELGHPLIPAKSCVRNSVTLGDQVQVLLVSGSNMSGKSTFLRTIGINVVLAMTGAPVRAKSLRMTRLRLGASIRITDSLQAGRSGFYAEISRLRQIMDLTFDNRCVLFLADELLHGTNSHDRRIGGEGLLRALLQRGAIGVVTTHDLALTTAAGDKVHNAHFQDELRDGRMIFDYHLHAGVVTKSNALELMRSVGLDV